MNSLVQELYFELTELEKKLPNNDQEVILVEVYGNMQKLKVEFNKKIGEQIMDIQGK